MNDHHLHVWTLVYFAAGILPIIAGAGWLSIITLGVARLAQQSVEPRGIR